MYRRKKVIYGQSESFYFKRPVFVHPTNHCFCRVQGDEFIRHLTPAKVYRFQADSVVQFFHPNLTTTTVTLCKYTGPVAVNEPVFLSQSDGFDAVTFTPTDLILEVFDSDETLKYEIDVKKHFTLPAFAFGETGQYTFRILNPFVQFDKIRFVGDNWGIPTALSIEECQLITMEAEGYQAEFRHFFPGKYTQACHRFTAQMVPCEINMISALGNVVTQVSSQYSDNPALSSPNAFVFALKEKFPFHFLDISFETANMALTLEGHEWDFSYSAPKISVNGNV